MGRLRGVAKRFVQGERRFVFSKYLDKEAWKDSEKLLELLPSY